MMSGFRQFLLRGNVVDLAVAVIIGAAFGTVVTAFVKDLVTPLIAAIGGQPDFAALTFTINNSKFMYGDFLNAVVAFIIVAAVIYFLVVVPMNRIAARTAWPNVPPAPITWRCPECLGDIPIGAKRCMYCTSHVTSPRA
jgi:large conductance mechanosensitive channel